MKGVGVKEPFYEQYEFLADYSKNCETAANIHTIIQFSKIKPSKICGKVFGTKVICEELTKVINQSGVYSRLESKNTDVTFFSSDEVTFPRITRRQSGYDNNLQYEVAEISLMSLVIKERYPEIENISERHLTFFLSGPRSLWSIQMTKMPTLIGEIPAKLHNSTIELNETFPFSIEVLPYHFYDKDPTTNYDLTTNVVALHFKTNKSTCELSDDTFLNQAMDIMDDLTILISFVSRRWVRWFRYNLETNKYRKSYIRRISECSSEEPGWSVVKHWESRKFLQTAFTKLRELRKMQFNPKEPIIYYVSGNEAKYLEDEFAVLFLSLEKLKDLYIAKKHLTNILLTNDFILLEEQLKNQIKQNVLDSKNRDLIYRKMSELNRPPLSYVLDMMFSEYEVEWSDLYPQGCKYTFINTRNQLFHSSEKIDMEFLAKEHERLRIIVERFLLKILGWSDLAETLTQNTKRWLTC